MKQAIALITIFTLSTGTLCAKDFDLQKEIQDASSGETITIPAGTYTQPVVIHKRITLDGQGATLMVEANQPAIRISTRKPVTLKNLEIQYRSETKPQQGEQPYAVYSDGGNLSIENCSFEALGTSERSPCAVLAMERSTLHIQNCTFDGFNFTVQISGESEGIVEDSLFTNPGHCGITIGADSTGALRRNIVTGSRYHGIRCTGGEIIADSNLIIANRNRGFYIGNRSATGTLSNNLIIDNATGINVFANSELDIINNVILRSSYAGLAIADTADLKIENNIIADNERGVIGFSSGGTPSVRLRGENIAFSNKTQTEGIKLPSELIGLDPEFKDPESGLFEPTAGKAENMGVTEPEVLQSLWNKWKQATIR